MASSRPPVPRLGILALLIVLVSGLVAAVATASPDDEGRISLRDKQLGWNGSEVRTGVLDTFRLDVAIARDHWRDNLGGAQVLVRWEDPRADLDVRVLDGSGKVVDTATTREGTSERVFLERASGTYQVVVLAVRGASDFEAGAFVESRPILDDRGGAPSEPLSAVACEGGKAGPFPCRGVDLAAFLPIEDIGGQRTAPLPEVTGLESYLDPADRLNDIWGWTDPQTGREYALVGKSDGVAFVDVTDAEHPRYLGDLPTNVPVETLYKIWRDMKVYKNHMYVVSEESRHGMQVFDLTRLRGTLRPQTWTADAVYKTTSYAHNIAINEDSGFAYIIGSEECDGGPHIVDIRDPKSPKTAGCVAEDGYTHDTQCVNYKGPDERYVGREICFNANEDTVTIVDVTDKAQPRQLSRTEYPGAQYTHQGWLTRDGKRFLVNDELDEQADRDGGKPPRTTTRVFDVEDLERPTLAGMYRAEVSSIDHNLYTVGDAVFEANYRSGLRILDATKAKDGELSEAAFFDIYPNDDEPEFNGAWSVFPYFASGTVVVSGIEQGLFVLRPGRGVQKLAQRGGR